MKLDSKIKNMDFIFTPSDRTCKRFDVMIGSFVYCSNNIESFENLKICERAILIKVSKVCLNPYLVICDKGYRHFKYCVFDDDLKPENEIYGEYVSEMNSMDKEILDLKSFLALIGSWYKNAMYQETPITIQKIRDYMYHNLKSSWDYCAINFKEDKTLDYLNYLHYVQGINLLDHFVNLYQNANNHKHLTLSKIDIVDFYDYLKKYLRDLISTGMNWKGATNDY